jgi:hypothetical protein
MSLRFGVYDCVRKVGVQGTETPLQGLQGRCETLNKVVARVVQPPIKAHGFSRQTNVYVYTRKHVSVYVCRCTLTCVG